MRLSFESKLGASLLFPRGSGFTGPVLSLIPKQNSHVDNRETSLAGSVGDLDAVRLDDPPGVRLDRIYGAAAVGALRRILWQSTRHIHRRLQFRSGTAVLH